MEANGKWAMPSWDTLFAGRKTALMQRIEQEESVESYEGTSSDLPTQQVEVIARHGQDTMEADLQKAVEEPMPNAVPEPQLAHLAEISTSRRVSLEPGSVVSSYPEVLRKSCDGHAQAQSAVSMPHVAMTSVSTALSHVAVPNSKGSPLAVPQEVFYPKVDPTSRPVGALQRAGRQEEGESSSKPEAITAYSDTPSGQWAEGAKPKQEADTELQADLWETLTSLFNAGPFSSSNKDESSSILSAVSHLQGILGEDANEQSQWKKQQEGDITKLLSQSSAEAEVGDGGEGYEAESGIRHQPTYLSPRLPIVFCHGLFGFNEFSLAPAALRDSLPSLSIVYWRGIAETFQRRGVEVLVAKVPMSASIEERAEELRKLIEQRFPHREINIIAHSMGGLDGRYLASQLETTFTIRSLTTIATPHRGSSFANFMLDEVIGKERLPTLLNLVEKAGLPGGGRAFACLTTRAMAEFNEAVIDKPGTVYMSWGAAFQPGFLHEFRFSWAKVKQVEGENDGLVSVESSKWAEYRGTLKASHLDLIGWTNKLASLTASIGPREKPFDPKALYLTICEDLAMKGL